MKNTLKKSLEKLNNVNLPAINRAGVSTLLFLSAWVSLHTLGFNLIEANHHIIIYTVIFTALFFVLEYLFINILLFCMKNSINKNLEFLIEVLLLGVSPLIFVNLLEGIIPIHNNVISIILLIVIVLSVNFGIQFDIHKNKTKEK